MSSPPTISVIIPTYNREAWIEKTLESVFNQTVPIHELFLMDDGSTDGTRARVEAFLARHPEARAKLRYQYQPNQGKSVALNAALEQVTGEWIAFNDSDDTWRPDKLEWQLRALLKHPECSVCVSDARFVNDPQLTTTSFTRAGHLLPRQIGKVNNPLRLIVGSTRHGIYMQTVLVRKTIMDHIGLFDVNLRVGQDTDFVFRLALVSSFCYVNLPLVDIDRTPDRSRGLTTEFAQKTLRRIESRERIFNTWSRLLVGADADLRTRVRRLRAGVQSEYATWYLLNENIRAARTHQWRAVRIQPTTRALGKLLLVSLAPKPLKTRLAPQSARSGGATDRPTVRQSDSPTVSGPTAPPKKRKTSVTEPMNHQTTKVALIGCGRISFAHVKALAGVEGVQICAVCDRDQDRAKDVAHQAGDVAVYSDVAAMLREAKPHAVHILTPPAAHAALAIQAMDAGCHVLVEKPMALSVEETDAMMAAAARNNVKLCVGHNYIFKPSIQKALRLVESGAIGDVVFINSYYGLAGETGAYGSAAGRAQSAWRWRLRGGVFTDFIPHLIYLQLAFVKRIERIAGVTMQPPADSGREPSEMGILYEGSGVTGQMIISMRAKPYAKFVDVYGTKGIVHADLAREVCTVHRNRRLPGAVAKLIFALEDSFQLFWGTLATATKVALGRMKSMPELRVLVERFYDSIRTDGPPPVTGAQGKQTLQAIEQIWERLPDPAPEAEAAAATVEPREPSTPAEREFAAGAKSATVFVTGGTGFLGQRLIAALHRCGAEVTALVRDEKRVPPELEGQARFVSGDLRDIESLKEAMAGSTLVLHGAAVTTNSVPWQVHHDINVQGTENVMRAAAAAGVKHVVHLSSVAVYGLRNRNLPVREDDPLPEEADRKAFYIHSKAGAEKIATAVARESGVGLSILRLGLLYGPGAARPVGRGLLQIGSFRFMIGTGRNHLPYTYVDNAVDCMLLAGLRARPGVESYNVVDGPPVRVREVAHRDGAIRRETVRLIPIPTVLLKTAAGLAEYRSRNNGAAPKLSRYVVGSAARDIVYDTEKARTQLGWEPAVSLEEGLRQSCR